MQEDISGMERIGLGCNKEFSVRKKEFLSEWVNYWLISRILSDWWIEWLTRLYYLHQLFRKVIGISAWMPGKLLLTPNSDVTQEILLITQGSSKTKKNMRQTNKKKKFPRNPTQGPTNNHINPWTKRPSLHKNVWKLKINIKIINPNPIKITADDYALISSHDDELNSNSHKP